MHINEVAKSVDQIRTSEDLCTVIEKLRLIVYNEKTNDQVSSLINRVIEKSIEFNNKKVIINLYSLKIVQIHHLKSKNEQVTNLASKIHSLSKEIDYNYGLALYYSHMWYIEKFKGNKAKSKKYIEKSIATLEKSQKDDAFIYHICKYTFAIEKWLEEHDFESIQMFEDCLNYFHHNKFYRSLAQTLGMLSVIYMKTQDNKKALKISIKILSNRPLFNKMPDDVKGIVYYFTSFAHLLNSNLSFAESSFADAYAILKPVSEKSFYFSNFITMLPYFSTVKALQGKIAQTFEMINEVDKLLKKEFYIKNLDKNTESQILHTLNLIKFYVYSRKIDFDLETAQDLIDEIVEVVQNTIVISYY